MCVNQDSNAQTEAELLLQDLLDEKYKEGFKVGRLAGIIEGIELSKNASNDALQDLIDDNNAWVPIPNIDPETGIRESKLFSAPISNGLIRKGLKTIGDVEKMTRQNLLETRNLGEKRVKIIAKTMAGIGHPLASE